MNERYLAEKRNRDSFEAEIYRLKKTIDEIRKSYDIALESKEDQIQDYKHQILELHVFKDQSHLLEDQLRESESKYRSLQQECSSLQKEIATLDGINKDQARNISSMNESIGERQKIIDEVKVILRDSERLQQEQTDEMRELSETNKELEQALSAYDAKEKGLKDEFNYKIEEVEKVEIFTVIYVFIKKLGNI